MAFFAHLRKLCLGRISPVNTTTSLAISAPLPSTPCESIDAVFAPYAQCRPEDGHVQFMSDLHLERFFEYKKCKIPVAAPYLVLAGDVGRLYDRDDFLEFLRGVCTAEGREAVLLVPGNHEYFHTERTKAKAIAARFQDELGPLGFVWMDKKRVELNNGRTIVLGCTLHSHIPDAAIEPVTRRVRDFGVIGEWDVEAHNSEYDKDCKWLEAQLAEIDRLSSDPEVLVASHFPPTWDATSEVSHSIDDTKYFYGSETLDRFTSWQGNTKVSHWLSGHTHENHKFIRNSTTFLSNHRHNNGARKFNPVATIQLRYSKD